MKLGLTIIFTLFAVQTFSQSKSTNSNAIANTKPFAIGVIDELYSNELGEKRILNIYLPEGYNQNDSIAYPVTYLLDGSANEDFIHVAGLYQFNSFEWVNRVPKTIIVGIATVDRRRDFTYHTSVSRIKKSTRQRGILISLSRFLKKNCNPIFKRNIKQPTARSLSVNLLAAYWQLKFS